ncbi:MAG: DinB family protein [Terracidiphilus sp.]
MDIQQELIQEFDIESAKTRKMLEAIPENADWNFAPHAKSMPLGKLADHVSQIPGDWALFTLTLDRLDWDPSKNPPPAANKAAVLAQFDKQVPEARKALAATTGDKWDRTWEFGANGQTWISNTRFRVWRELVLGHMGHHRAQLGVYLRLLDAKVPGMFGPSADEM